MFESTRKEIIEMIDRRVVGVDALGDMINRRIMSVLGQFTPPKPYACETCGCLIAPEFAVKGELEIRQRQRFIYSTPDVRSEDYIYTPYYCKVHAPKGKK